jgi:signal transduction histidine kinase
MLLENLFSWSVNQLNEMHFNVKENDIQRVVNETITILKSQAEQKQISLSSNLSLPVFAYFDFETISIVLRNLITNALKFTPEGGQVVVSFVDKINSIEVFVTDNGVGISKDNFNILFCEKTFYSTRGTANEKGSGFGLLLCREFVERNGGTLKVDSTVGEGSTFSFSLPKVKP